MSRYHKDEDEQRGIRRALEALRRDGVWSMDHADRQLLRDVHAEYRSWRRIEPGEEFLPGGLLDTLYDAAEAITEYSGELEHDPYDLEDDPDSDFYE